MNASQLVVMQQALDECGIHTNMSNGRLQLWDELRDEWLDVTDWSLSAIIDWIKD